MTNFRAKKAELEAMTVSVGQRMDAFLDILEGRQDSVPEKWIDQLEALETDFVNWVFDAEKRATTNEWIRLDTERSALDKEKRLKEQVANKSSSGSSAVPKTVRDSVEENVEKDGTGQLPFSLSDLAGATVTSSIATAQAAARHIPSSGSSLPLPAVSDILSKTAPSPAVIEPHQSHIPVEQGPNIVNKEDATPILNVSPRTSSNKQVITESDRHSGVHASPKHAPTIAETDTTSRGVGAIGSGFTAEETTLKEDTAQEEEIANEVKAAHAPSETAPEVQETEAVRDSVDTVSKESTVSPKDETPQVESTGKELATELPPQPSTHGEPLLGETAASQLEDESTTGVSTSMISSRISHNIEDFSTTSFTENEMEGQAVPESLWNDASFHELGKGTSEPEPMPELPATDIATSSVDANIKDIELRSITSGASDVAGPMAMETQSTASVVAQPSTTVTTASSVSTDVVETLSSRTPSPNERPAKLRLSIQTSTHPNDARAAGGDTSVIPERRPPTLESPIKLSDLGSKGVDADKDITSPHRRKSGSSNESIFDIPSSARAQTHAHFEDDGEKPIRKAPPPVTPPRIRKIRAPQDDGTALREHHLLQLESQGSPASSADKGNRDISLPLQRFISDISSPSLSQPDDFDEMDNYRFDNRFGHVESPLIRSVFSHGSEASFGGGPSSPSRSIDTQPGSPHYRPQLLGLASYLNKPNINKRLRRQPSLESLGLWKADTQSSRRTSISTQDSMRTNMSRSFNALKQPTDFMDEQISSILTQIPARIHLLPRAGRRPEESPILSSLARRARETYSESPEASPSASSSAAPSLFLASVDARSRRQSTASHMTEDRSARVYHLGDQKSNPTKLFIRPVGESSERLMVRVGGGWADLSEYLKEYAFRYGNRRITGPARAEPDDSMPDNVADDRSSIASNAFEEASRPASSAVGSRPSSPPLFIRKTRRSSNVSNLSDISAARSVPPKTDILSSIPYPRGRQSWSSLKHSASSASLRSDSRVYSSPLSSMASQSTSTPLGLAGPRPRSRHVSMTPESQAWVDDVIGQARRTSNSLRPPNVGGGRVSSLPKTRSVSDIGAAALSRRRAQREQEEKNGKTG